MIAVRGCIALAKRWRARQRKGRRKSSITASRSCTREGKRATVQEWFTVAKRWRARQRMGCRKASTTASRPRTPEGKRPVLIKHAVCTEGAMDFSPGVRNANGVSLPGVSVTESVVP